MTSVVVWRRRELMDRGSLIEAWEGEPPEFPVEPWIHEGDIWLAADSRISMPTEHGRIPTTDAAMKILPITLRFFQEHEDGGPGMTPTYHSEIAFAWAGDTQPASATYQLATSYLKAMHGPAFEKFPTISDIADMIGRIGARYAGETERRFEAFVVGQTPHRTGNPPVQVFKFGCDEAGRLYGPREIDLSQPGSFHLLGSHKPEISAAIDGGFGGSIEYVPARAIKAVIAADAGSDIGGSIALARVSGGSVELYPGWRDPDDGLPRPYADEAIARIGEWRAGGIFG
ncbi:MULTISPECIES: hypothetical protein [Alphaproteobacteria]|jgi:hypothetical protein|nr:MULTISPECIES: hypothetical protein [Alphaproteobacteria]MBB3877216.1 hypothetical protein [Sphingomonas aquatilis]MBB4049268.1 hypothetical protein [Sphingomonas zeae]MBB4610623.1 hypothetical protein [Sphingomonas yabuuchiae]MBN3557613.1 hypothetical protein [Sphingomonas yabuuchiae]MDK8217798.1 hypothetical protein [Sphingomonas sp. UMB7805-LC452B]